MDLKVLRELKLSTTTVLYAKDVFYNLQGIKYLIDHKIIVDETMEIAKFIHHTNSLSSKSLTKYLKDRYSIS